MSKVVAYRGIPTDYKVDEDDIRELLNDHLFTDNEFTIVENPPNKRHYCVSLIDMVDEIGDFKITLCNKGDEFEIITILAKGYFNDNRELKYACISTGNSNLVVFFRPNDVEIIK